MSYVVAVPGAAEMDGLRSRFGGQTAFDTTETAVS
jgi:hypothetical protein